MDGLPTALADEALAIASGSLARVWIVGPGDSCPTCAMAPRCPSRVRCLHLVASAGLASRLDGPYRRIPLGAAPLGEPLRSGTPLVITRKLGDSGVAEPAWLALHGIEFFGAWPMLAAAAPVGVLGLFGREAPEPPVIRAIEALARIAAMVLSAPSSSETRPRTSALEPPTMAEAQRSAILSALQRAEGRVSGPGGAAEILHMKPTTLESRIRRLGLRKPPFPRRAPRRLES